MPAGCVQHQADTTRAPTFHSTLVRRLLQLTGWRAGPTGLSAAPEAARAARDTVAEP